MARAFVTPAVRPIPSQRLLVDDRACDIPLFRYQHRFRDAAVDGAMLLALEPEDLSDILGIENPLHRRKIVMAIEDLRDVGAYAARCVLLHSVCLMSLMHAQTCVSMA